MFLISYIMNNKLQVVCFLAAFTELTADEKADSVAVREKPEK